MDDATKKAFKKIDDEFQAAKKDISSLKLEIQSRPTYDDMKTLMRNELKQYVTKSDLKQVSLDIIEAIERGMGVKADKTEVLTLAHRVTKLEKIVAVN